MLEYWERVLKDAEIEREIYIKALRYDAIYPQLNKDNEISTRLTDIIAEKIQTVNETIKQAKENVKKIMFGGGEVDN